MDNNPIGELMQNTMESVKNILKVDTVVGDPIYTPDGITLVPISKVSVGFGGGGVEFNSKKTGEQRQCHRRQNRSHRLPGDQGGNRSDDQRDAPCQQYR